MTYYRPFKTAAEAEAAFVAFVAAHGGVNGEIAQRAFGNAFAVEVCDEYEDDLHRWTVALATARDDVEQG